MLSLSTLLSLQRQLSDQCQGQVQGSLFVQPLPAFWHVLVRVSVKLAVCEGDDIAWSSRDDIEHGRSAVEYAIVMVKMLECSLYVLKLCVMQSHAHRWLSQALVSLGLNPSRKSKPR